MREMKDSGVEWLGEVPAEWALRQAGQLADQTKVPNEGMIETNLLSLSYGKVKRRDINATDGLLPTSFETYNVIEPNDIVLRFTDLQNDQKSLRVGMATERGIITSAYVTIRPLNPSYSRFMYYALHAYDLRKGFYGMGAGVRQGLKWQEAKYIKLPWPDDAERNRIADFLDEKCNEIDCAVSAAEQSIEEYKAYRLSVISTKMPTGCITIPIKYLCDLLPGYAFESGKFVQGNGVRLLRGINVGVGETRWADAAHYPEEDLDGLEAYALEPGDLVIGLDRPWIKDGLRASFITESDLPCYLVQRVVRIRVLDNLEPRYLKYGLDSGILERYVASGTTGISVPHISHLQIANCKVPLPSLDEQRRIADYLDEKCGEVDAAIVTKQAIIADLKTYKKSLIYETVTGKREV